MAVTKSPLRYPGGKTQLSEYVKYLMDINDIRKTYVEPFAGGFGVALELLFSDRVDQVVMNDYDPSIFSIWYSILNNYNEFKNMIISTDITIGEWYKQKSIRDEFQLNPYSIENAFATFFLNRTNRSGIINAGPIGGINQEGKYKIDCRFNKKKLLEKIEKIYEHRDSIIIENKDANVFINENLKQLDKKSTFVFFDPPYFKQGQNLYLSFFDKEDHKKLSKSIIESKYKWITTYDISDDIFNLYSPYVQTYKYELNYSAYKRKKASEYLFASNDIIIDSHGKVELFKLS